MRRTMPGLVLLALLAGSASPVAAQEMISARLCLEVEVPVGVTSVDADGATEMIRSGEMTITDTMPCDAEVPPPSRSPRTDSSDLDGAFIGAWFVTGILSGERGGTTAIAGMNATEGISSGGEPITLSVRCNDDIIDMLITWGDILEAEQPKVTLELGSGHTESFLMRRSVDHTATFYPQDLLEAFLESLSGEATLTASVDRTGADPLRAVFDVARAEEALTNVRAACAGAP